jgi:hypothetical protein
MNFMIPLEPHLTHQWQLPRLSGVLQQERRNFFLAAGRNVVMHQVMAVMARGYNDHRPGDEMCELVHAGAVEGNQLLISEVAFQASGLFPAAK